MIGLKKVTDFFEKGHERSVLAKKNAAASFLIKGGSMLVSLLMVPLTLRYLDAEMNGVWLTVTSMIAWFNTLDIGLGNGMRNKLTEALAKNDLVRAKRYVSTTYIILTLISAGIFIVFACAAPFLQWHRILNTNISHEAELGTLAYIVVGSFCLQFIGRIYQTVLMSAQQNAQSNLLGFLFSLVSLVSVYVLTLTTQPSLVNFGIAASLSPILVLAIASIIGFSGKYKALRPSLKAFHAESTREIAGLGSKFFIIQVAGILMFYTGNVILTQMLGGSSVTAYNVAFRYLDIPVLVFSILLTPLWSASTDAYHKHDFAWLSRTMNKVMWMLAGFIGIILFLTVASPVLYHIWIGNRVYIPLNLTIAMAVLKIIILLSTPLSLFLNGLGKVNLQMYSSIFLSLFCIPLAVYLVKFTGLNVAGVVWATAICQAPTALLSLIQYRKIISGNAAGIWNR
ncbi:MAG: oligosaccharide flippase family protein [Bacteroidota bacterium]